MLSSFYGVANAAVEIDSSGTGVQCYNDYSTGCSTSVTVGNNSNRILIVHALNTSTNAPNVACTYGDDEMTLITDASQTFWTNTDWHGVLYLLNPSTGNNTLSCTHANTTNPAYSTLSIYNAKQQAAETIGKAESTSKSITSVTDNALITYFAATNTNNTLSTPENFTEHYQHLNAPYYGLRMSGGSYILATAGAIAPSVTNARVIAVLAWEEETAEEPVTSRRVINAQ